ncbi:hypothetical protein GCM10008933_47250 [Paenibacillus motobuensis]|uniref:Transposase n=1 Tax=Paenibacillus motobuensis TaxID=295324 RepID=A0ABN0YVH1_9BACL
MDSFIFKKCRVILTFIKLLNLLVDSLKVECRTPEIPTNIDFSNETGYRYLGRKGLLQIVTKLGITIEAKRWPKVCISLK